MTEKNTDAVQTEIEVKEVAPIEDTGISEVKAPDVENDKKTEETKEVKIECAHPKTRELSRQDLRRMHVFHKKHNTEIGRMPYEQFKDTAKTEVLYCMKCSKYIDKKSLKEIV